MTAKRLIEQLAETSAVALAEIRYAIAELERNAAETQEAAQELTTEARRRRPEELDEWRRKDTGA